MKTEKVLRTEDTSEDVAPAGLVVDNVGDDRDASSWLASMPVAGSFVLEVGDRDDTPFVVLTAGDEGVQRFSNLSPPVFPSSVG